MSIAVREIPKRPRDVLPAKTPPSAPFVNVGPVERTVSVLAGAALLAAGMFQSRRTRLVTGLSGAGLLYRGLSGNCMAYQALGIDRSQSDDFGAAVTNKRGVHFDRSLTINKSPADIYTFWRDLPALPRLIDHLESVTPLPNGRTSWVARGPLGVTFRWDTEMIDERQHERMAWRSLPGSEVDTAGSLHLTPLGHGRGTAVRLVVSYDPPGGRMGATLGSWLGTDVEAELFEGLRRMKNLLEAGEIPTTESQPTGACARFGNGRNS